MRINFEKVRRKYRKLITTVFNEAIKETQNDYRDLIVTVSFAKEDQIRNLNRIHRKVDRATDVLSFPMLDIVYPQKVKDYLDEISPDGSLYLGDIVICKKIAKKQAKEYGHSKKREIAFLALHGLLHLLGYDHIQPEDEKIMHSTSKEILNRLNIKKDKQDV